MGPSCKKCLSLPQALAMEFYCNKGTITLGISFIVCKTPNRTSKTGLTAERAPTDIGGSKHFNQLSSYLNANLYALTLPFIALQARKRRYNYVC
jgi:hypothetical protein